MRYFREKSGMTAKAMGTLYGNAVRENCQKFEIFSNERKNMSASLFSIGVSGHQNLGNHTTEHFVAQQFRELLRGYQQAYDQVIVYSSLAKGADQLFVHVALEEHIPVEVVLPCTDYEQIFASDAEKATYHHLLRASSASHLLPAQACSNEAFLAAGQWIVDRSNLMLLAWNGLPARGRGGTGDIASYARTVGCPFIHIHTRHHTVTLYGNPSRQEKKIPSCRSQTSVYDLATTDVSRINAHGESVQTPDARRE